MNFDTSLVNPHGIRAHWLGNRRTPGRTRTNIDEALMQGTLDTAILDISIRQARMPVRAQVVQRKQRLTEPEYRDRLLPCHHGARLAFHEFFRRTDRMPYV
jgi:hypothetical protein